jgi:hypothetical protein
VELIFVQIILLWNGEVVEKERAARKLEAASELAASELKVGS